MTRLEFLEQLRKELQGSMSQNAVNDNIDYYDSYIREEMGKGISEEEVLQTLGDPWIIAQTIADAGNGPKEKESYESSGQTYSSRNVQPSVNTQNQWWKKLLIILVIVMVVMGIFTIGVGLIRLLAPIVVPVLIVILVVRLIKGGQS